MFRLVLAEIFWAFQARAAFTLSAISSRENHSIDMEGLEVRLVDRDITEVEKVVRIPGIVCYLNLVNTDGLRLSFSQGYLSVILQVEMRKPLSI